MNESEIKKCPKCGGEMEIGYLLNGGWNSGKRKFWGLDVGRRIDGFSCRNCGYLELYLEKKEGGKLRMSKA